MNAGLFVDFGSTYTKVVLVELDEERLLAVGQAPSTVNVDITVGMRNALETLKSKLPYQDSDIKLKLACSSAAGGLRMVAIGLVTELTAEAAKRAALGAGAKVLSVFSYRLSRPEVEELEKISPDIILLAGGTDGGDRSVILHNARCVAASRMMAPVVIAGNKEVSDEAMSVLQGGDKPAVIVANVLPELDRLNVEPAREAIRDIFMKRIVKAKGLSKAIEFIGDIIMPTPMATLNAARLLADGGGGEAGLGELIAIEVGGATTNVHSIGSGFPSRPELIAKGLPEPYAKRTVEGDLGLRINAMSIFEMAGRGKILANMNPEHNSIDLAEAIHKLSANTSKIPATAEEFSLDTALARIAVDAAVGRHLGTVEVVYTPAGPVMFVCGKDLTETKTLVGTGGVFAHGNEPRRILEAALFKPEQPNSLRPKAPSFYVDRRYIMYAMGLLGTVYPDKAVRIMKASLERI